jgi:hypothetical protein
MSQVQLAFSFEPMTEKGNDYYRELLESDEESICREWWYIHSLPVKLDYECRTPGARTIGELGQIQIDSILENEKTDEITHKAAEQMKEFITRGQKIISEWHRECSKPMNSHPANEAPLSMVRPRTAKRARPLTASE